MSNTIPSTSSSKQDWNNLAANREFLTFSIAGQLFGVPILQVQDVLGEQRVTRIPLAPPEVAGALNLRGRIVTSIDVRSCLRLPPIDEALKKTCMSFVVEHEEELYSLTIDKVGDVLRLSDSQYENSPPTLDPSWRALSMGVYRLDGVLLVILDIPKLIMSLNMTLN